jgi:hypothetical protein
MGDDPTVLNGAFATGNAFEHVNPPVQRVQSFDTHQIGSGFSVLGDEHRLCRGAKLRNDPGSSPL